MKKQFLFIVIALISFTQLNAQDFAAVEMTTDKTTVKKDKITRADISDFQNEQKEIINKIQALKLYPERAMDYGVEGRVVLEVEFDGKVKSVNVVKSAGKTLDNAALNAVKEYEKHYLAKGKEIKKLKFFVPILFKI